MEPERRGISGARSSARADGPRYPSCGTASMSLAASAMSASVEARRSSVRRSTADSAGPPVPSHPSVVSTRRSADGSRAASISSGGASRSASSTSAPESVPGSAASTCAPARSSRSGVEPTPIRIPGSARTRRAAGADALGDRPPRGRPSSDLGGGTPGPLRRGAHGVDRHHDTVGRHALHAIQRRGSAAPQVRAGRLRGRRTDGRAERPPASSRRVPPPLPSWSGRGRPLSRGRATPGAGRGRPRAMADDAGSAPSRAGPGHGLDVEVAAGDADLATGERLGPDPASGRA